MRATTPAHHHRGWAVAAVTVAAGLAGAPLLAGSPASADPAGTITFTGGCGLLGSGLGAESTPDITEVQVPSGTGIRFANQLGQEAQLRLDGEAAAELPAGGAADVTFHSGPVTAAMQIQCLLGTPAGAVTVEVVPADERRSAPPASSGTGSSSTRTPGSDQSAGSDTAGPSRPAPGPPQPDGWRSPMPPPAITNPSEADIARDSGSEPADRDETGAQWRVGDPLDGGGRSADPARVDSAAGDGDTTEPSLSRTSQPAPENGPIGLLALIATVCVVGVSAGAVRAILTQRARSAEWS